MHNRTLKKKSSKGFTLVEIIMVVVILSIAALIAVPMFSNAADIQVRSAANRIAADLDYAKSLAITNQKRYAIVFDSANESYEIRVDPFTAGDVIDHPVNPGSFVVDFSSTGNLDRVDIGSADFDSGTAISNVVTFDYLGSPYSGTTDPLNSGLITLQEKQTGNFKLYVKVEPVTGYTTIDDTP